jgi:hypothetical protein
MKPEDESSLLTVLHSEGIIALADKFEIGRYLSKLGCLDSDEEILRFIAPRLTESDVLALHSYLKGFRSEFEWRAQFEMLFAGHVSALPEPDFM